MYKETYINGVKQSEEPIPYSLLEQNSGHSPVISATYTNSWGGAWMIEKSGNSLKITTASGGSNPSGGIHGVRLMPGTSYTGTINTDLILRRKTLMMKELGYPSSFFIIIKSLNSLHERQRLPYQKWLNHP